MLVLVLAVLVIDRAVMRSEPAPVTDARATGAAENSITVLALEDLSPEGHQEYFAEGPSDGLLNILARVSDLKVADGTSMLAFKGINKDLPAIGDSLNAGHLLGRALRRAGYRICVYAELITADDGFNLFSDSHDRDVDDGTSSGGSVLPAA
jgi:TolB-like protein